MTATEALVAAKTSAFLEWLDAPDETFEEERLWAERLLRHLRASGWDVTPRKGVEIENSQTNEEAFGVEPFGFEPRW